MFYLFEFELLVPINVIVITLLNMVFFLRKLYINILLINYHDL